MSIPAEDSHENCPFCLPEVQRAIFAESSAMRAVVNRSPILPGHTLIMPSRHVGDLYELTGDEFASLFAFARRIGSFISHEFGTSSFDWTIQNGEPAGQTVNHVHLHIIPRRAGDFPDPGDWYPRLEEVKERAEKRGVESARADLEDSEQAKIAQQLASDWNDHCSNVLV